LPAISHPENHLEQPRTSLLQSADARQPKKRRLATPLGQTRQASPGTFSTSSAISSPAM
jgi:hypothetical protein